MMRPLHDEVLIRVLPVEQDAVALDSVAALRHSRKGVVEGVGNEVLSLRRGDSVVIPDYFGRLKPTGDKPQLLLVKVDAVEAIHDC